MHLFNALWPLAVIGLFNGSIYSLAAMGVVLTYKTSGIFNFAYGGVAMFCGFTFWKLRDAWGLPQWISLPLILLVVAPLLALVSERLFRSVTTLSAEIQIVIALGALAFLQAIVPLIYGKQDRFLSPIFSTATFSVTSHLRVSYNQLFTLLLAGALSIGLWALLRHTRFGTATQAVVDNRDLAEMIGVSADTVSRVAWLVSSVFAALVGILLSSTSRLDTYTLVLVVIFAFAPAVLGRLVSLPLAFGGAIFLGVFQSVLTHWGSSGTLADFEASVPYLALFALLLFYGRRLKEVRSSYQPLASSAGASRHSPRRIATTGGLLLAVAIVIPAITNDSLLSNITAGTVLATIALTLVVLTGWSGQISLAQFSFVGIGAFAVGNLAGPHGGGFLSAAILGAIIAIPVGLIIGLPSLRLSGLYLALATMAFALTVDTLVYPKRWISGGTTGLSVPRPKLFGFSFASTERFYYLTVAVFVLFAFGAILIRQGPIGRRLQMMRDAPMAAATFGVNLTLTKLAVFAASGAGAAFAGALYGAQRQSISPMDFSFGASLALLLLVVLGGRALVGGALVAGVIYTFQIVPSLSGIQKWLQLGIAVGVIYVAQYPDGPLTIAAERSRILSDLFRPLPRNTDETDTTPAAAASPASATPRPEPARG
ncbi:MAG: ABC transporter permease [Actinobacteria bacterium]|nr:ABC transporter permease [Actinomycetota bacterium]